MVAQKPKGIGQGLPLDNKQIARRTGHDMRASPG